MNSYKPLTAEDADFMRSFITCAENCVDDADSQEEEFDRITLGQALRIAHIFEAALSLLAPPTDAAVREAVERLSAGVNGPWEGSGSMFADIRTLLRAVQAPRLTGEQMEAVRKLCNKEHHEDCPAFHLPTFVCRCGLYQHMAVCLQGICAAFPEAFAGEVDRGE